MKQLREYKHLARAAAVLTGAAVAIGLGVVCLRYSFGGPLIRASYDLPFPLRATLDTHEVTLVYLDEYAARQLNQPIDNVWNRALHVPLLDRLTHDGARLVFYDIVFDGPAEDPAADAAFAESIAQNGKVVLGAALDVVQRIGSAAQTRVVAPIKPLRKAAAGYGVLAFQPVDSDYGVRQMFFGTDMVPTATWKSAELLGAPITGDPRQGGPVRWINYYGPPDTFRSTNIAQAIQPGDLPDGFFKDQIVLIGGRSIVGGGLTLGRDEFATAYSRWGGRFSTGLEVHANLLLNLVRGEWLRRMPETAELMLIIGLGLFAGLLGFLRPVSAIITGVVVALAIAAGACLVVWHQRIWFGCLIPVALQIPAGLTCSLVSQYMLESRRRKELRRAFGFYLSPEMAEKISNSDFDLRPGGKLVDVTVIFTDLENFTTLSEHLDPREVSEVLTSYFGETTQCILGNRGTIIKYVGDAVMAAWGAPIDDPLHAVHATEAACALRGLSEMYVRGIRLRTRIGIHSGRVVAGNLGSKFRFDYTMIGDPVNFASRLESLNKYLSTQVLISDAVRQQLDGGFVTRLLGKFQVSGKTDSVVIHELLSRADAQNGDAVWIEKFEEGLTLFRRGDFAQAAARLEETRVLRGGTDGPASFYLRKIPALQASGVPENWAGVVELSEK